MLQRNIGLAPLASLAVALLLPAAPAQASEVVKLARLVITGKRLSAEPPPAPAPAEKPVLQHLPPVLVEGQSSATQARSLQLALHRRGSLRAL
jgi:hypothetical protein